MALHTLLLILLALNHFQSSTSLISTPDLNSRYPSPRAISVSFSLFSFSHFTLTEIEIDLGKITKFINLIHIYFLVYNPKFVSFY